MNKKIFNLTFNVEKYYDTTDKSAVIQKDDIQFKSKGIYIAQHHWNGGKERSSDIINQITQRDIDWTNVKTMYRFPNLSLSRDKLSLLKDKYGSKVVRDQAKADVCIISNKTVEKLISADMYYGGTWTVKQFIEKKMPELRNVMTAEAYIHLQGMLDHLQDDWYIHGPDRYNSWDASDEFNESPLLYFTDNDDICWRSNESMQGCLYIANKDLPSFKAINDPNKVFLSDVYVNQVCSEDSITLDWEQYENIKKMLSATREDKAVAMTLMANCKIEESKTVLGLLFYHYADQMKGTPTWNQVAFKTLRKQFDHYQIGGWNSCHTNTFSQLIQKLAEDNALTEDAMKHVCQLVFERVLADGCGFNREDCAFEMNLEDVRLTQQYKDKLIKEDKTLSELVTGGVGHSLPFDLN